MNTTLTYTDPDAAAVIAEVAHFAAHNGHVALFCTAASPLPGLPLIPPDTPLTYQQYRRVYQTAWGNAVPAHLPYRSYPALAYHSLFSIETASAKQALPDYVPPVLGAVQVNPITGLTQIYLGDGQADDFVLDTSIWHGELALPSRWEPTEVLTRIRRTLVDAGVAVYPSTLFVDQVPYPWLNAQGIPLDAATISNTDTSVPLSGYALDVDTHTVITVNLVGHKTSCRSIWGSLNTRHHRTLTVRDPVTGSQWASSTHNYATYSQILNPDTGLTRLTIIDKGAFAPHVENLAYLVLPAGTDTATTDRAFAARLSAVLPVGVPASWGAPLREAGIERQLVRTLACGGDVAQAYALDANAEWFTVITDLLQSGDLTLPEALI